MADGMDPSIYKTLGELVAEVRELRRTIEANAAQVDRRLTDLEVDMIDLQAWKNQMRGGATLARWVWTLLGTGAGGTVVALILGLR
jgi:hypothetical protein